MTKSVGLVALKTRYFLAVNKSEIGFDFSAINKKQFIFTQFPKIVKGFEKKAPFAIARYEPALVKKVVFREMMRRKISL